VLPQEKTAVVEAATMTRQMLTDGSFGETPPHMRRDGRKPLNMLPWTMLRRPMLRPNVPLDLVNNPYLIGMMSCTAREQVFMKSGQIRITELLLSYAFHACDERYMDIAYIMPTYADVSDMSQQRIGTALEASPYLDGITNKVDGEKKRGHRGADKVDLKRIRDNWLILRSGNVARMTDGAEAGRSANRMKSFRADGGVADEFDEMMPETLPLLKKRFGASPIQELRIASTPSYHNTKIHAEWLKTDQREWFVRCPHCGRFQMLTIDKVIQDYDELGRPSEWHGKKDGRAFIACENKKCGKELNRMAAGEWVPTYFGREIVGWHPTKLMSCSNPLRPDDEIMLIVLNLMQLEQSDLMQAWNQDLGLPWSPKGGKIDDKVIGANKRNYSHGAHHTNEFVFMGVDISPTLKHTVIRYFNPLTGEYPQLYAGTVTSFGAVAELINLYNVDICVVDGAPETEQSLDLRSRFTDGRVWLAYFSATEGQTLEHVDFQGKEGYVRVARTRALDSMYARWFAGKNVIPANISNVPDYLDQIKAPTRVIKTDRHGNLTASYTEGSKDDHFAFAELYAYVASKNIKGWFFA